MERTALFCSPDDDDDDDDIYDEDSRLPGRAAKVN